MNAIRDRRKRAATMREQKKEQMFLQELENTPRQNTTFVFNDEKNKNNNIKRLRMQNSKGTSGMFIKP
tara:strand:+ start:4762 stop:4965 length:204 start_codon:yes stop_codon:yes gene_type:complete